MSKTKNITEDLKSKLRSMVRQVLIKEHNDVNKQKIKEMPGRINFACPYCGDSHNESYKKRGNLYWTTLQYHCFNCGIHSDVYSLLKDNHVKFKDTNDSIQVLDYIKDHKISVEDVDNIQHGIFKKLYDIAPTRSELKKGFGLVEIEPGDAPYLYLKNRLLSHKLNHFLYSPSDKRIAVLNIAPDDKIVGLQTRALDKKRNTRYLTYDIEKISQILKKDIESVDEELAAIKKMSTLFGIMTVNFQVPVTIFEGPLDALFMNNSLALTSVSRSTVVLDEIPTVRYMFDNDKPGKTKMLEKLKNGKQVFVWSKFLTEYNLDKYHKPIKDLNDLVIASWRDKNQGIKNLDSYFTNSKLDAFYL